MAETKTTRKPESATTPKLEEIAQRIDQHLHRFEKDPRINAPKAHGTKRYYQAGCWRGGSYINVRYIGYQHATALRRQDALTYLEWLDAGNEGKHWAALDAKAESR